jgi:hypothetical protein
MRDRAEDFMDQWLDENVDAKHVGKPKAKVAKALAKKCATDAKKAGVPIEELEEVVVDIEEAIADELTLAAPKGSAT